jgi:hypothetical protein
MTLEEFEIGYAERSGVTVEWLHENGQRGESCECGLDGCDGWAMMSAPTPEELRDRRET